VTLCECLIILYPVSFKLLKQQTKKLWNFLIKGQNLFFVLYMKSMYNVHIKPCAYQVVGWLLFYPLESTGVSMGSVEVSILTTTDILPQIIDILPSRVQWFWHFFITICFKWFGLGIDILRVVSKKAFSKILNGFYVILHLSPPKKVAPH